MPKPNWVVVLDFDGTLISKYLQSLYDLINDQGGLNEECLMIARNMRKYYISKSILTAEDQEKWLYNLISLYVKSGLSLYKIEEILRSVKLRDGAVDCLLFLKEKNVPVAIVSYEIFEFIDVVLRNNRVKELVSGVYSAKLLVDNSGLVLGFNPETAVYPANKGKFSCFFADRCGVPYENILAVGDSGGDARLGHLKENRFGIAWDKKERELLEPFMGEVAVTENFYPVTEWLIRKIGKIGN